MTVRAHFYIGDPCLVERPLKDLVRMQDAELSATSNNRASFDSRCAHCDPRSVGASMMDEKSIILSTYSREPESLNGFLG